MMKDDGRVTIFPILHGRAVFAQELRRLSLSRPFDCIAVDLPEPFEPYLADAVGKLPEIHALAAREAAGPIYYCPIDPCDAAIEAVRQSMSLHLPLEVIGHPDCTRGEPLPALPDEHAITTLGLDAFCSLAVRIIRRQARSGYDRTHGSHLAARIIELRKRYRSILAVVHLRHCPALYDAMDTGKNGDTVPGEPVPYSVISELINADHLYFALGELPFITGKYEMERYDPLAPPFDPVTAMKDLFRETRETVSSDKLSALTLSPVRIQAALTFLRNLTVLSARFLPSLFDIVEAAKGVGGNRYALQILKNAKYYPWFSLDDRSSMLGIGLDKIRVPAWGTTGRAVNILRDHELYWRTLSLRPDPTEEQRRKYRYTWNPRGMCSHVPEDLTIERFNGRVRGKAHRMLMEDHSRTEKFNASVKDGIDIRETIRNWHTGGLYVRELPPARGKIDTVVIIFDADHDEKYPNSTTWYAEHPEESTLSFYATPPFGNLIGPGIARCEYGGLALLFPPRSIPDIFQLTTDPPMPDRRARLTMGALMFSRETHIAYVAAEKPGAFLTSLAKRFKRKLLWIPLSTFSLETITRLRTFHILNGKQVRSWATRFIGE